MDGVSWYCTVKLPLMVYGVMYLNWMPSKPKPLALTSSGSSGVQEKPVSKVPVLPGPAVAQPGKVIGVLGFGSGKLNWNWNGYFSPMFGEYPRFSNPL